MLPDVFWFYIQLIKVTYKSVNIYAGVKFIHKNTLHSMAVKGLFLIGKK